ncbi:hypothetical protein [Pseudogemmobacter sp. W21_MBD1_M6]|uniref:hypothetical protein n=1 Tax=Pseudogemmobacter sp. W21_MBD1_M6 TaxID=3240271 RepID=UPI003F9C8551
MRNAALMLGVIGGIIGMIVGFFGYGYTVLVDRIGADVPDLLQQVDNVQLVRAMALFSPLLAIAGGAMARSQPRIGGALMLVSSVGMYYAFGYGFTTMFPIAFCALGGVLALAAVKPDPH